MRFEVFKRDGFRCVYCGVSAAEPGVVLHADHQHPVKTGGENHVLNLVTSCSDCNLGKGATPLGNNTLIASQVEQMEKLQERREILQMMAKWRSELKKANEDPFHIALEYAKETAIGVFELPLSVQSALKKALKKHSINDVYASINQAQDKHILSDRYETKEEMLEGYTNSLVGSLGALGRKPHEAKTSYAAGILKNRFTREFSPIMVRNAMDEYLEACRNYYLARDPRATDAEMDEHMLFEAEDNIIRLAKEAGSVTRFASTLNAWSTQRRESAKELGSNNKTTALKEEDWDLDTITNMDSTLAQQDILMVDAVIQVYLFFHTIVAQRPFTSDDSVNNVIWQRSVLLYKAMMLEGLAWIMGDEMIDHEYAAIKTSKMLDEEGYDSWLESYPENWHCSDRNPALVRMKELPKDISFGFEIDYVTGLEMIEAVYIHDERASPYEKAMLACAWEAFRQIEQEMKWVAETEIGVRTCRARYDFTELTKRILDVKAPAPTTEYIFARRRYNRSF